MSVPAGNAKAKRPTIEQHAAGLRLYRANTSPDRIAELTSMKPDQVEQAIVEGWPARGGKTPAPALPGYDSVLEDRSMRIRLARLDWAQVVAEAAAPAAKERAETARLASRIERLILNAWAAICEEKVAAWKDKKGKRPRPADLSIPLETVRSLRALRLAQDPGPEQKLAELFKSIRGEGEGEGDSEDEWQIIADLVGCTQEEEDAYIRDGTRPSKPQQVLPFERKSG